MDDHGRLVEDYADGGPVTEKGEGEKRLKDMSQEERQAYLAEQKAKAKTAREEKGQAERPQASAGTPALVDAAAGAAEPAEGGEKMSVEEKKRALALKREQMRNNK